MNRKERPRCRKKIRKIIAESGLTLEEIAADLEKHKCFYVAKDGHRYFPSDGLRTQVRKMRRERDEI